MPLIQRNAALRRPTLLTLLLYAVVAALCSTATLAAYAASNEGGALTAGRALVGLSVSDAPAASTSDTSAPSLDSVPRLVVERLDGETLADVAPFDRFGYLRPDAMRQIERAFAAPSGEQVAIHPRLVEVLLTLSLAFDNKPIVLVSAHRVPGRGTRKTSYHVSGMAADIVIRGVKIYELRKAAMRLGAWGVGVYPTFVHIDVRNDRPYRWSGGSRAGWRRWRRMRGRR